MSRNASAPSEPKTLELYVSPKGRDKWSGRRPDPNKSGTDGPLAGLEAAQKAVRKFKVRGRHGQPVRVNIRRGTYVLKKPLVFTHLDSGTQDSEGNQFKGVLKTDNSVTWAAYRNEKPVISGGRRIKGLRKQKLNGRTVWVADIPEVKHGKWTFHQLWVNGRRRFRPRLPRDGFYRIAGLPDLKPQAPYNKGQRRFVYREGDIQRWAHLRDVEIVVLTRWVESRMRIRSLNEKKRLVNLDRKSRFVMTDDHKDHRHEGTEYYVENVFEALENPGEWYLDREAGTLYYVPMPGERIASAEIVAPVLSHVISLDGNAKKGKRVEHIHFRGITFSHTEWMYPDDLSSSNQAANQVPATIRLRNAHGCRFDDCAVRNVGTYGIELLDGCSDVKISGCDITDLGAGGVKVWHGCRRNTISDCEIGDGGAIFHSAVGILIGKSSGNRVLHNHVHDFYYTGISVGWTWGYAEGNAYGNVIEYNRVHDIGKGYLSDMGGIYTLGVSPGTRIRNNVFHDINCRGYGGWAIYTDEGSSHILIENNLSYRANSAPFHQHYGRENVLQNNIWALGRESAIERSRIEPHDSIIFRRNIIYLEEGAVLGRNWQEPKAVFEDNLYFDPKRKDLDFGGRTFREWHALGMDKGSLIADPKFVNPARGDFRLRPCSPAFKLGFRPFDLSEVGPRQSARKRTRC